MKGVVFTGNRQLEVRELADPEPGPEQVLVRMAVSSICGTDMHFYRKSWDELVVFRKSFNGAPDTVPGHEPCGVVEATGANVTSVAAGERVTVYPHVGCGTCGYCCRGEVMFCPERTGYGSVHDGSCAEYILAGAQLHAHPRRAQLRPRGGNLLRRRHGLPVAAAHRSVGRRHGGHLRARAGGTVRDGVRGSPRGACGWPGPAARAAAAGAGHGRRTGDQRRRPGRGGRAEEAFRVFDSGATGKVLFTADA